MGYDGLKTARTRLTEIETELSKVKKWGGGASYIEYADKNELIKEQKRITSLILTPLDLDKPIIELEVNLKNSDKKVYIV